MCRARTGGGEEIKMYKKERVRMNIGRHITEFIN